VGKKRSSVGRVLMVFLVQIGNSNTLVAVAVDFGGGGGKGREVEVLVP
jgi:hypothetical protein